MHIRTMSEYYDSTEESKAIVKYSSLDESFFIEYVNVVHDTTFYVEDCPNRTLKDVEVMAQDWTLGLRTFT